ncbi:MAG: hypothetical protein AAGD01_19235 [Acidobacteriota bacterium]
MFRLYTASSVTDHLAPRGRRIVPLLPLVALLSTLWLGALPQAANAQLGELCDPGEAPPRAGFDCQPMMEETVYHEPQIFNAKRGDVLLSAGCGMIGNLLRRVQPPQRFSHSGIMVVDRTRVRHSTAVEARYPEGSGGDGIDQNLLQYGWPGIITEPIYQAYEGSYMMDPDFNQQWWVSSFNANQVHCDGDETPTNPSIVKPPFDTEAMTVPGRAVEVRDALHQVADEAEQIQGHYRFFAYSEADLVGRLNGPGGQAPADGSWWDVEGRLEGTVCSQLVWSAASARGFTLEDPTVEPGDRPHATTTNRNGLYLYSADERLAAGTWLYDEIYNQFYDQAGWFGRLLTDAPDDGANQVVNCFAFDWCGDDDGISWDGEENAKDSDRWRQDPGVGIAVSPDDISHWDLPTQGGLYGLTETIAYRPGGYRPTYRWARSQGTGDLRVTVRWNGNSVGDASVVLDDQELQLLESAGQWVTFLSVPAGQHQVDAWANVDAEGQIREGTAEQTVTVIAGQVTDLVLDLATTPQLPPSAFRSLRLSGNLQMMVDDTWPNGNDHVSWSFEEEIELNPSTLLTNSYFRRFCHDDVRAELSVNAQLTDPASGVIEAHVSLELYEDGRCGYDDSSADGTDAFHRVMVVEDSITTSMSATNCEWTQDDNAQLSLNLQNLRDTDPSSGVP